MGKDTLLWKSQFSHYKYIYLQRNYHEPIRKCLLSFTMLWKNERRHPRVNRDRHEDLCMEVAHVYYSRSVSLISLDGMCWEMWEILILHCIQVSEHKAWKSSALPCVRQGCVPISAHQWDPSGFNLILGLARKHLSWSSWMIMSCSLRSLLASSPEEN